ncbi:hypothetical protein BU23DRAFT_194492 [Bimuria novae-zelandiae CBS 107.79]|uniref:Uncharacterized protein n=1 Tax=Bimuria novae-zelandiae CBS 107.79 TaxID=1447943 RepID=A0A6A5V4A7_9PLEO|nr:hypothetical protein BU23DRAFT_194492 [Bimuria novae-zelandiae CBS 107.79]
MSGDQLNRVPNNTPQPPEHQGANNSNSQAQNSTPAQTQNGTASSASEPPSASMTEFMCLTTDEKDKELHEAISRSDEREGGRNGSN